MCDYWLGPPNLLLCVYIYLFIWTVDSAQTIDSSPTNFADPINHLTKSFLTLVFIYLYIYYTNKITKFDVFLDKS